MDVHRPVTAAMLGLLLAGCTAQASIGANQPPPPPPPQPAPAPAPAPPPPAVPDYITISDRIQFETGNAILLPVSLPILDEVVDVMSKNPHITHAQVGGHTDSVGHEDENLLLSQSRAEAVRAYLITKGIAANRLSAMGFGQRVPVASNDTTEGREKNRRVEFRVVKQAQSGP